MKKLLIIITLLISQLSYGDVGEIISNAIDSTKVAVNEGINTVDTSSNFKILYNDIKGGLTTLAAGLKVGVEHVYEILVKQQIVNSIVYLITGIIGMLLISNFLKKLKDENEKWNDCGDPTGLGIIRIIQCILGCIMLFVFFICLDNMVMGFVNPEYGAINEVMNTIKNYK